MKIARNPYLNRSMIRTAGAFYGRRREIARLTSRLAADTPQSVALVGDRRVGKSSLLFHVSRPEIAAQYLEAPDRVIFLFLDFQEELRPTITAFIEAVLEHLQPHLPAGWSVPASPDYDGLQRVVQELDRQGYRLILLLDEFDRVTRNSRFDADFFAFLRSLAGHHNVGYVTSTTRDLQQLCHTEEISDSPFFNIFTTLPLGPLQPEEALALIREPSARTPFPLEPHQGLILELGGHLPIFLQIACSAAFELLVEEEACLPDRVADRFLEEAQPHFQFCWEQFDAVARGLCNQLAGQGQADPTAPRYQELLNRGFILPSGKLFSSLFARFVAEAYAREVGEEPVEVQAERTRGLEEELAKARATQLALLPQEQPDTPGFQVAGQCEPATHVGGDFFTYQWLDPDRTRLAVVAVDVMGHGMQGAVTALRFSEILRYEARGRTRAADLLTGLNQALCGTLPAGAFVACGIVVLDLGQRRAEAAVAGYPPPLHYHRDAAQVSEPDLGGTPLGIRPDSRYQATEFSLGEGDCLLLHSDGVTEARDDREAVYGEERLRELLQQGAEEGLDAAGLLSRLFWDVGRFSASAGRQDDITAIVVRVTEEPGG